MSQTDPAVITGNKKKETFKKINRRRRKAPVFGEPHSNINKNSKKSSKDWRATAKG